MKINVTTAVATSILILITSLSSLLTATLSRRTLASQLFTINRLCRQFCYRQKLSRIITIGKILSLSSPIQIVSSTFSTGLFIKRTSSKFFFGKNIYSRMSIDASRRVTRSKNNIIRLSTGTVLKNVISEKKDAEDEEDEGNKVTNDNTKKQKVCLSPRQSHGYSRSVTTDSNACTSGTSSGSSSFSKRKRKVIDDDCSQSIKIKHTNDITNKDETNLLVVNNINKNIKPNEQLEFIKSFLEHDTIDFHMFTNDEAIEIRNKLLQWYRINRRKLPWRGDAPPWDGSTANFAESRRSNNKNNNNNNIMEMEPTKQGTMTTKKKNNKDDNTKRNQTSLTKFFTTTRTTNTANGSSRTTGSNGMRNDKGSTTIDANTKGKSNSDLLSIDNNSSYRTYPITAYGIWVSEIMLQQTRVDAVVKYWIRWMDLFPTVYELANATEECVNSKWMGLGFYRRARLLHTASKVVVEQYNGIVPNTVSELMKLPGIGKYTASAIASIAYNVPVPVVDGNVCRVLSRLRCIAQNVKSVPFKDLYGYTLAQQIIDATASNDDKGSTNHCAGEVNQAMMELGATYCSPAGTGIDIGDPLLDHYWSTKLGTAVGMNSDQAKDFLLSRDETASSLPSSSSSSSKRKTCPICEINGPQMILQNLLSELDGNTNNIVNENPNNTISKQKNNSKVKSVTKSNETSNELLKMKKCGHCVFPLAPPKKMKREEVLAVIAISCQIPTNEFVLPTTTTTKTNKSESNIVVDASSSSTTTTTEEAWLMIRRPNSGLLAGQWEFPSVCVWSSLENMTNKEGHDTSNDNDDYKSDDDEDECFSNNNNKMTKKNSKKLNKNQSAKLSKQNDQLTNFNTPNVPIIPVSTRRTAIYNLMLELFPCKKLERKLDDDYVKSIVNRMEPIGGTKKNNTNSSTCNAVPLEHIFSHVRHTMYVEYCEHKYDDHHKNQNGNRSNTNCSQKLIQWYHPITGQEIRWMRSIDMEKKGVTAGVKKILSAVGYCRNK